MPDLMKFATDLALSTGSLLSTYYTPFGIHASQKSDRTAVTEADIAADRLITNAIMEFLPQDGVITEESSYHVSDADSPIWIIDPLDGTTNFSLGVPIWGISIARIEHGFPSLGVLYFPPLGELYTCSRGSGSFLNDEPISTKTPSQKQSMSFFACCSRSNRYYDIRIPYKSRILGSGAYTFCMVARGAALLGMDAASKIWDLAAGWLLVEEAGGIVCQLSGSSPFPILSDQDYQTVNFPILAAANQTVFKYGRDRIKSREVPVVY